MARKFSFDELLAKREQREADRLKIGMLAVPGSEYGLEARMPSQKAVLDLYGELVAAADAKESFSAATTPSTPAVPSCGTRSSRRPWGARTTP